MDMNIDYVYQFAEFNNQSIFNASDFCFEPLLAHHQPAFQPTNFTRSSNAQERKVVKLSESSSVSTFDHKQDSFDARLRSLGRVKRGANNDKLDDITEEVINVKSRRRKSSGSHSAAERVRREKINHKFRCLQELIPGCYNKAMGMAVMLEEIINYVQSLQNQVEFLSMELAAASSFQDLNMEKEAILNAQGTNTHGMHEIDKLASKGYGEHTFFR